MKNKYKFLFVVFILTLTALACGQLDIGIEEPTQPVADNQEEVVETQEPQTETQPENSAVREDTEKEDFSEYWAEVEDYRTGLRFAMPCFWVANIPSSDTPGGLGSFSVNNFTEDFIFSLGPKRGGTVWEIGGLKFDLGYHTMSEFNLAPNSTLEELAYALVNPDQEHGITSTEPLEINGKQAIQVNTWSTFGEGRFYMMPYINDLYVMFAPFPVDHPDLNAILHSLVLDPSQQVLLPKHQPAGPPEGMAASCMGQLLQSESEPEESSIFGVLDCAQVTDADPLMWIICNVQDSFRSRNTQPLLGYMGEPFMIGYWQSEGVERTRDEALAEIVNYYLPEDTSKLTFTMDRNLFPPLFGMQPEQIVNPEINIVEVVYSEGWGQEGLGALLLYFAETDEGNPYLYGIIVNDAQHFDK